MGVTLVVAVMFVVIIFLICMVVMIVVLIMIIMFAGMERHVVCSVGGVNFSVICVFFFIGKFDVFERSFRKRFTQIGDEDSFVIEGFLTCWHGVDFDGCRCVITE